MKNHNLSIQRYLIRNLAQFGLNPNNWKLSPGGQPNHWYIVHKKHCFLNFRGIASYKNKKKPYWRHIEVPSLNEDLSSLGEFE